MAAPSKKYGVRRVEFCGVKFDSPAERDRWRELRIRRHFGDIRGLLVHPKYKLTVLGKTPATYTPDFEYLLAGSWEFVVEDVKSKVTAVIPVYRLKVKLFEIICGTKVTEVLR